MYYQNLDLSINLFNLFISSKFDSLSIQIFVLLIDIFHYLKKYLNPIIICNNNLKNFKITCYTKVIMTITYNKYYLIKIYIIHIINVIYHLANKLLLQNKTTS